MVIRKGDRVSTLLKHDESLVEVFASISPAFEKLRNPGMRKVMARLVTVEQAARMAGIGADDLVRRLNGEASAQDTDAAGPVPLPASPDRAAPAALREITWERIVTADVREDLRAGREPFSRIMAAKRTVPAGGALCVRAIFEPVPLYAVMAQHGFAHHTEKLAEDDWQVWFYAAPPSPAPPAAPAPPAGVSNAVRSVGDGIVVLDVRGLEPPEPMVRTLEALERLPAHGTLVQVNVRVPQFLLPRLEERGFTYEVREQAPDLVRVFIRRGSAKA